MKPTLAQQRKIYKALPAAKRSAVTTKCRTCAQRGDGFMSILKSIGSVLGPIAKEIGPVLLKDVIIPMVGKKIQGNGLKLAGQGKPVRRRRK